MAAIPECPVPHLLACDTGREIRAEFVELTASTAFNRIDRLWWHIKRLDLSHREGDEHWQWNALVERYEMEILATCVGVDSIDAYIEGAAIFLAGVDSVLDTGSKALYIDRLATAPRNRPWLTPIPFVRGVGVSLLRLAVWHSLDTGCDGRLVLCSLPTPSTVSFYEKRGFVATNRFEDRMMIYELPPAAAWRLFHGVADV